jgi:predicted DNA-binding antitoxin AbrB/MazE fold protein
MNTHTIQAVYRNGVLHPVDSVDLPDGATIDLQVVSADAGDQFGESLFGSFPVASGLVGVDFGEVMKTWRRSQGG